MAFSGHILRRESSRLVNFSHGHGSPVTYFLVGLSASLQGSKGENLSLIECVTLTNVYNREAF